MPEDAPTCGKCLFTLTPADFAKHAERLAEKEWRSIKVGPEGENADEAELAYKTMQFMADLAWALKSGQPEQDEED